MKWVYGLTTVPSRRDNLLPRTLESLKKSGFGEPHLFIDACDDSKSYIREFGLPVTCHSRRVKTVSNWWLTLWELYYSNPKADRFAIFQDDIVTGLNLKAYLESQDLPEHTYWNLFSFRKNEYNLSVKGWRRARLRGFGALGLVFSNNQVQKMLCTSHMVKKPHRDRAHICVDGAIWTMMNSRGCQETVHNPSLVQHIGGQSSMREKVWNDDTSKSFLGEDFDYLTLSEMTQLPKIESEPTSSVSIFKGIKRKRRFNVRNLSAENRQKHMEQGR